MIQKGIEQRATDVVVWSERTIVDAIKLHARGEQTNRFEVIDFVKKNNFKLPIAVVSAVSHQALTKLDLDVVKLVISKPFDVDEFTKAVVSLCCE